MRRRGSLVLLMGAAIVAPTAAAKAPGENGPIVFGRFNQKTEAMRLFTVKPDGGAPRDLSVSTDPGSNTWSPDGSRLLISDLRTGLAPLRPATIAPDGSGFTRLGGKSNAALNLGCTAWSPDSARIACQGFTDKSSQRGGIYTIRSSDGGGLRRLTRAIRTSDVPGDYSPDGSRIVFLHGDPSSHACDECGTLFVVNADGTGRRRITPRGFAHDQGGSWSPDGRRIVFERHGGKLYTVRPNGKGLRRLRLDDGPGQSFAFSASWSPDARRIVFSMAWKRNDFQVDVFTTRADGTHLVQITDTPAVEESSDWGPA